MLNDCITQSHQTERKICDTLAAVLNAYKQDTDAVPVARSFLFEIYKTLKEKGGE